MAHLTPLMTNTSPVERDPKKNQPSGDWRTPKGGGSKARRRKVPPTEVIARRAAVAAMLANGIEERVVLHAMGEKFGMTRAATKRLMSLVVRQWGDDEVEQRPRLKQMAVRRLLGHVAAAKKAGAWGAVASFERILSEVQGTREPEVVEHRVAAELRVVVGAVVAGLTPDRLIALADRALAYRGEQPLLESSSTDASPLAGPPAGE